MSPVVKGVFTMSESSRPNAPIHIIAMEVEPTILFAAQELAKYLGSISARKIILGRAKNALNQAGLRLGITAEFPGVSAPEVPDIAVDDAIVIDTAGDAGVIAGVNPRSVLLAVYRYLTELGCRWVRPGADGEQLPSLHSLPSIKLAETPSYRHRAVCIEGAVSYEHVRDMVDWIPKLGFNGYFIQFREAHTFFDRWYAHTGNPIVKGAPLDVEQARTYTRGIEKELAKRGLLYHKVGHGWTCEPFGISGLGWEQEVSEPAPEIARYLAEVNGGRKLWRGVALNTNLCYSNSHVRRTMAEAIVAYAREHPEINYVHVWLADGSNNNCECAECQKARPADYYVAMLNKVDELLAQEGLATRIVFLVYVDLLWPPEKERFRNPGRFVLMFAPIGRTYSESFAVEGALPALPPYERNKLTFPKGVAANVAFLRAWQDLFDGDSFDFDYHLMWEHVNDPGHMQISRTIAQDMKNLAKIGLNGFVSCQINRMFFPTALAMTAMGGTLWDTGLSFDDLTRDYFAAAFGPDAESCRDYLVALSDLFDPPYMRGEREDAADEAAAKLARVAGVIRGFMPTIEHNMASENLCHATSWQYLKHHAELTERLAQAVMAKASGDKERAAALWQEVKVMAWEKEPELHRVFDPWLFARRLERNFA